METAGDQLGEHPHIPLLGNHGAHRFLVVPCLLATGDGSLEKDIVPLGVKEPLFITPLPLGNSGLHWWLARSGPYPPQVSKADRRSAWVHPYNS